MTEEWMLSNNTELKKRRVKAKEFFDAIFDQEEKPYFVSDEATLYDVFSGEESELMKRCERHYGVRLEPKHFGMPFWKILDYIESKRKR